MAEVAVAVCGKHGRPEDVVVAVRQVLVVLMVVVCLSEAPVEVVRMAARGAASPL